MKKKLDFIGLVDEKQNIKELQDNLSDGQILVSTEGEIWRWDGFSQSAEATPLVDKRAQQLQQISVLRSKISESTNEVLQKEKRHQDAELILKEKS